MSWEAKTLDDTYSGIYKNGELVRVNVETTDAEFFVEALAACAAGPWRTDVENAPKDGSEVWGEFYRFRKIMRLEVRWQSLGGYWETFTDITFEDHHLRAFAVPNPPQVKP